MNLSYSLHKITDQHNCPFSESEYSKFKFGDSALAEKFAEELFNGFISEHAELILSHDDVVILPSPYHSIPTASNYLSFHFKTKMNTFLYENNKKALVESKIHRNQTYTTDYGNLDYNERVRLIANDTYYIDRNFINGKFCLFMDDIKITGSHEHIVKKILNQYNVEGNFIFVYYAELLNKEVHPNIENYYNYFFVKDVVSLSKVINAESFVFNTRTVKYILKLERADLLSLMALIDSSRFEQLFHLSVSNNYHTIADYKENLSYINQSINKNKITQNYGYQFTERST
jgi:hypothetical protein